MSVRPRYTLSDQLWFFVAVLVLFKFMSVNIGERPIFEEKKAVHFDRGVFANVIFLVLIFTSKAEF